MNHDSRRSPLISSVSVGWEDLGIAYDWYPPGGMPKILSKQHNIGIFTDVPSVIQTERTIDGRLVPEQVVQGNCVIVPANTSQQAEWNKEGGALTIAIDPNVFAQTIYEVVDPDSIELLPQFATPDPLVYQVGVALKLALTKRGTSSRLYAETLVNTLILHLLEHYSTTRPNWSEYIPGKLPQYIAILGLMRYTESDMSRSILWTRRSPTGDHSRETENGKISTESRRKIKLVNATIFS